MIMVDNPNNYDTLLDSDRGTDFLLSNNRHRVGLRNFCFSIANRNVPFYLEKKMSMIQKECLNCKKQFKVYPHREKTAKFCSMKCRVGFTHKIIKCKRCGKDFWDYLCMKTQFCSRDCYNSFNNGKNSSAWKGGKTNQSGYFMVWDNTHPNPNHDSYIREHRLVMEKHLGRYLRKEEKIHHINGIKTDNRIENLLLCADMNEHMHIHQEMQKLIFKLIQEGKVYYDRETKQFRTL